MNRIAGLVFILASLNFTFSAEESVARTTSSSPQPFSSSNSLPGFAASNYSTEMPPSWDSFELPKDLYTTPTSALSSWGVGNGGDWLRIGFARARDHAATIVSRLKPNSLRRSEKPDVRDWILKNQQKLAADILASQHIWGDYENEQPSCAWTWGPGNAAEEELPVSHPIRFAYSHCRDAQEAVNFNRVTQLLIHESVHHFGHDCNFADEVAIEIANAWRNGWIDWMPVEVDHNTPSPRESHSAVWTGKEMIIYGGHDRTRSDVYSSAAAYDPETATWRSLGNLLPSEARFMHQAHWTELGMVVWGGYHKAASDSLAWRYSGFIWNEKQGLEKIPMPHFWNLDYDKTISRSLYPRQQSVWTGKELIVVGGVQYSDSSHLAIEGLGASYNPATKKWSNIMANEPHAPQLIQGHSMVWTGSKLIVWGGLHINSQTVNTGAIFDPAKPEGSRWSPIRLKNNSPIPTTAREGHQAVWTGQYMVVFGGLASGAGTGSGYNGTGGIFDPTENMWYHTETEMVMERVGHSATWNGQEMLVFGGRYTRGIYYLGQVSGFEPTTGRWYGINSQFGPGVRENHTAVWTGSSLIIWGGYARGPGNLQTGGIFYP